MLGGVVAYLWSQHPRGWSGRMNSHHLQASWGISSATMYPRECSSLGSSSHMCLGDSGCLLCEAQPLSFVRCPHLIRLITLSLRYTLPSLCSTPATTVCRPDYPVGHPRLQCHLCCLKLPLPTVPSHLGHIMLVNGYGLPPLAKAPQLPPRLPANLKYALFYF